MINLCCTKAFLNRLKCKPDAYKSSDSVLGDWYAKELRSGKKRYFTFMSNRTGLSLFLPARMHELEHNFRQHLGLVLYKIGAPAIAIKEELVHASELNYTITIDRSSIGCLNQVVQQCQWVVEDEPYITEEALEEYVFDLLIGGPNYWRPGRDTLKLLINAYQDLA